MRRDQEPVLRHCVEQAGRFERDSFAAGIRAGDDKGIVVVAKRDIDWHNLFLINERMARLFE